MSFIRRDGFFVSTDEAYAWLEESQRLAEESDYNEAMTEALKALSWFQSAGPSAASEDGLMASSPTMTWPLNCS